MLKNGIYNLLGTVVRLGLSILSVPLLIKFIGTASYGLYSILFAIINFASLTEWSILVILTVILPRELASPTNHESKSQTLKITLLLILCLSIITAFILWVSAPYVIIFLDNLTVPEHNILEKGIKLASLIVFSRLLQQYFIGIEQAYGKYKLANSINTFYNLIQTSSLLSVAWLYKSVLLIIATQVFVSIIFVFCHAVICHRNRLLVNFNWRGSVDWNEFKSISFYSFRTYLGALGSAFFSQGDRIVVGKLLGLEASGIYAALTGAVAQIHALAVVPVQPLVPAISTLLTEADNLDKKNINNNLVSIVSKAIVLNVTIAVSFGCLVILMAPEIEIFLFNGILIKSVNIIYALSAVACIYTIYAFNAVGYYILFAVKKEAITISTSFICGLLSLYMIYVFGKSYGLIGAFLGNSGYILTLYMLFKGFRSIDISWKVIYRSVGLPMLILLLSVIITANFDYFLLRASTAIIFLSILVLPLLQQNIEVLKSFFKLKPL